MKYFYSPGSSGFYLEGVHQNIPQDAIELTEEQYRELLTGQGQGKTITYKSRKVQLLDIVIPEISWDEIRARRDELLAGCDWTQIPDNALSSELREQWRLYRQKLRDITSAFNKASKVVWPMDPSEMEA